MIFSSAAGTRCSTKCMNALMAVSRAFRVRARCLARLQVTQEREDQGCIQVFEVQARGGMASFRLAKWNRSWNALA